MNTISDKFSIVGIGETPYVRGAGMSTRKMAGMAIKKAIEDAGLSPKDVDGMMSYHIGDSTTSPAVAHDLGIQLNYHMDVYGGGSSSEALVGLAIGAIAAGMCHTVVLFRSMNGYSGVRMGASGARAQAPVQGSELLKRPYGWLSPGQRFAPAFMRHMRDYGTTSEQVAHVKSFQSTHAVNNPRALYPKYISVDDVLNSRWITKPLHILDCCVETDNSAAIIVTTTERARDMKHRPVNVLGVAGRVCKPFPDFEYGHGPLTQVAARYAKDIVFPMAGIEPKDVDLTSAYDAFTWTVLLQLENYGFCEPGEGGDYVSNGTTKLGGARPNNTSGGQLCEGYTHGLSLIIENARQLRWQADDYCPNWRDGEHTFDYSEHGCRQVREPQISMNLGWGVPQWGSALITRRG